MRRLTALRGPLILAALTLGLYWKIALTDQYTWLNQPDLAQQVLPWQQFQAREWHEGRFPLWDPYHLGGQPIIGQNLPGAAFPPNWLLFLLPFEDGRLSQKYLNWYFILTHYLGALFCYLLCRDLKRSVPASVLAGAAFGMGGYLGTTDWPQMMNGVIWAPLVLLFFLRAMRGGRPWRNAAVSGAFLGISLLSGHHQVPTFIALAILGVWIHFFAASGFKLRRFVPLGLVFACFVLMLGALQLLPGHEYWKTAVRWTGAAAPTAWNEAVPYTAHARFALSPAALLGIVFPGITNASDPFTGLVVLLLAAAALAAAWKNLDVRILGALALGGAVFALGNVSVFHGVSYALVPGVDKARNPSMALSVFQLGLAPLAAFGLDALASAEVRAAAWFRRLAAGLWILSAAAFALLLWAQVFASDKAGAWIRLAPVPLWALLAGLVLHAWRREALSGNAAAACLILLSALELGTVAGYNFRHREQGWTLVDQLSANRDVFHFLGSRRDLVRADIDDAVIPFNAGDWHGLEQYGGYMAGIQARLYRVLAERQTHLLLGATYYVGAKPKWEDQVEVFQGASGLKVFRNPEAFPRVWTVHETAALPPDPRTAFLRPVSELRRQVFLEGAAPRLEACEGDQARVSERAANRVVILASLRCRGMVVLNDSWFPGWKAWVDDVPVPIYQAYSIVRGVVVEAGEHRIEMRYRPAPVYRGAALTGVGLVALAALLALPEWRFRRTRRG